METNISKFVSVCFVIFSEYIVKWVTLNLIFGPVVFFKLFNCWQIVDFEAVFVLQPVVLLQSPFTLLTLEGRKVVRQVFIKLEA